MKRFIAYFFYIVIVIYSNSMVLFSQNQHQIDSLEKSLSKAKEDTNKVRTLNKLAELYIESVPDKGLSYSEKAFALAEKLNYKDGAVHAMNWMGNAYRTKGNYSKALEYFNKYLKDCVITGKKTNTAVALNNIGNVYIEQGNYDKGLENFLASLKIFNETGDKGRIAQALGNIGVTFLNKGASTHNIRDYENALKYTNKALELDNELNDKYNISIDLVNIGAIYSDMGKLKPSVEIFTKALDYFQKSLKLKEEVDDKYGKAVVLVNTGDAYIQQGKLSRTSEAFTIAISNGKKALIIFKEIDDPYGTAYCLNKIGQAFAEKNEIFSNSVSIDSSIYYLNAGLKIAGEINAKDILKDSYSNLSEMYEKKNNFKQSLIYERLYSEIKDTLLNEENTKHMNEMQTKYETAEKDKELILKDTEITKQQAEAKQKATERNAFIIGFAFMLILAFFIFRSYRQKQQANITITQQKKAVELQKEIIEEKNKDITDSINYARRIQRAMITSEMFFKKNLSDFFVLYKPKDIVSGDFYWGYKTISGTILVATADCTGHGVPGAFMSMIGVSKLNEIVVERNVSTPSEILNQLRHEVIKALNPEDAEEEANDGMDISICAYDLNKMKLEYANANNSIYLIRNGELTEKKADKMPVGKYSGVLKSFTNNEFFLQKEDIIYSFTDGYADQFGGDHGKKFKYKQLQELLISIHNKSMEEQKQVLDKTMEKWKRDLEQIDDILIIGIRI